MEVKLTKEFLGDEEEADLVEWLVADGATVNEGDVIASIETSKIISEIVAPVAGVITFKMDAGELVELDATLATIV